MLPTAFSDPVVPRVTVLPLAVVVGVAGFVVVVVGLLVVVRVGPLDVVLRGAVALATGAGVVGAPVAGTSCNAGFADVS
jgi:hypothetical protein